MILALMYSISVHRSLAVKNLPLVHSESSVTPDLKRTKPLSNPAPTNILPTTNLQPPVTQISALSQTTTSTTLGPNLILNPSLENTDAQGNPIGWGKGGYGTNTRVFSYPVTGASDPKAARVSVSNYVSGDAKWYFTDVPVTPGAVYQFSDYSMSGVPSIIDVRYAMSNGTFVYTDIASVNPSSTYQNNTVQITIPQNVISLTIFHLIKTNGTLTVDNYSLNQVTTTTPPSPPPPSQNNLVQNGDFEISGANSLPQGWSKGGFGTNNRVFSFPVTGVNGSKAVNVSITSYTTGDAKWYFAPIPISPGIYTYSDQYTSSVPSTITVQFIRTNGTITYKDIASLPASSSFASASADFSVDASVQSVTVFHLIQSVGNMTLDGVSVLLKGNTAGIFTTGAVTLRFDDGWLSQYQNAIPKMNSSGIHGTFYIVSQQLSNNGFPDFMSKVQVASIFSMGNEIGAHTRTHPFLSQLTVAGQQSEIQGSRSDLLSLNVGPILSFAYPYGDYSTTTISIVQSAGFTSAAATLDGFVSPTSDKYQMERQAALVTVPFSEYQQWIDSAVTNKRWLIIAIHKVDTSGDLYSITPTMFNQIVDYLVQKQIPVITISQGIQSM